MQRLFLKRVNLLILISSFLILSISSVSQNITGQITDSKTNKLLVGVEVFINKTAIATQSDETGQFRLDNVLTGFQEIILYKKGYAIYRAPMKIQSGRSYNLKLSLTPSKKKKTTRLKEEEKIILDNLIASKDDNSQVTSNVSDVEVSVEEGQRLLASNSPLTIQNNKTGYRLSYYIMDVSVGEIIQAPIKFEVMPSVDVKQSIECEKNRKNYFIGTTRHWLMTLVASQCKAEGYIMLDEKGNEVEAKSLISSSSLPGYSKLTVNEPLMIHFRRGDDSKETSRLRPNSPVDVSASGLLINTKALIIEGDMINRYLANQLPIDYLPIVGDIENEYAKTIERFYEKVYVHTDKPYYYPGEPMWFKGYINYKEPSWRDSLSKVMYVELINPKKQITLTKTLKIDSGLFHNDFILPDTLKEGTYYLRAYTNLNRNFGDSNLFVKPIPIINITDKVDHSQGQMEETKSDFLTITTDKKTYKTREKITLTISVKDKEGKPLATNLSISVTDAVQVVPIAEPITIMNGYPFENTKQLKAIELKYPVEYGISFTGRFLNDRGKPEQANLTVLQMKPRNMMMATTDEKGIFSLTGLNFYDTATFSFKSDKAKDYPYGKVELLPRKLPAMNFKETESKLTVQNTQSQQRIISEYEVPKDARMLEEVVVKGQKIEEGKPFRSYGYPDNVIQSKDINQINVLYSLAKLPGVFVDMTTRRVIFTRAASQSIGNVGGPLVTIDDVPMGGTTAEEVGELLSSLNPGNIESIEITKRLNPLYGSQGANGVIAIYLKKGVINAEITPNFQLLNIQGYHHERKFQFPNYNSSQNDARLADYRSTVYWNPDIVTNSIEGGVIFSFFATDLEGIYKITLEGITSNCKEVRNTLFVKIEND